MIRLLVLLLISIDAQAFKTLSPFRTTTSRKLTATSIHPHSNSLHLPSMITHLITSTSTSTSLTYKTDGDMEETTKTTKIMTRRRRMKSKVSSLWQKIQRLTPQRYSVYVLELENNKYYVGSTNNRRRRMKEHASARGGSKWTRLHKPIRLVKEYRRIPSDYYLGKEAQVTAELMLQHGINNVRGAMFAKPRNYTLDDVIALTGFLGHYNNLDYKKLGSMLEKELGEEPRLKRKFMVDRKSDICFRCKKRGHWASECPELVKNDKGKDKCFRCGQRGHWANECPEGYPWVDSVRVKSWRYGPSP